MKTSDFPENLRPYVFHGLDFGKVPNTVTSGNAIAAECPLCSANHKFGVSISTGQFRCVVCEEAGNIYSFFAKFMKLCCESTSQEDYEALGEHRRVSPESIMAFGVGRSLITGEWLIPGHNENKKITNIYRVFEVEEEETIKLPDGSLSTVIHKRLQPSATPGCKLWPMGTNTLEPQHTKRLVLEGPWDGMAAWDLLHGFAERDGRMVKVNDESLSMWQDTGCWSAPSAGNFQPGWMYLLDKVDSWLMFDNDYPRHHKKTGQVVMLNGSPARPGWSGQQRVLGLIPEAKIKPLSVNYICWGPGDLGKGPTSTPGHNPDLPNGYDFRDAITERGPAAFPWMKGMCIRWRPAIRKRGAKVEEPSSAIVPLECNSFEDLCNNFEQRLHFTPAIRKTLCIMIAATVAVPLPEDPWWLRVIGPPGSCKTTLAECISANRDCTFPSSLQTGFHSGAVDVSDRTRDLSIIEKAKNKMFIIKDADTLVKSPKRDVILSELRDIYDGATRAHYRHDVSHEYEDLHVGFMLCGTDALRNLSAATYLGERFLDCEIMEGTFDQTPILHRAHYNAKSAFERYWAKNPQITPQVEDPDLVTDTVVSDDTMLHLKRVTSGFLKYLSENLRSFPMPIFSEYAENRITNLAVFTSYMRARIEKTNRELNHRPRAEVAGRLTKQLTKAAFSIAIVLGKHEVDEEILELVTKIAMDTAKGFQFEIVRLLLDRPNGLAIAQIASELQIPDTTVRTLITDMYELKIVQRRSSPNNSGQRGRNTHLWQATDLIYNCWTTATTVFTPSPRRTPRPRRV